LIVEYHRFIVKNIEIMWYTTYLSIRINCEKIFLASEIKDERSILGNIEEEINKLTYSVILISTFQILQVQSMVIRSDTGEYY
jgi:hypothetical protein